MYLRGTPARRTSKCKTNSPQNTIQNTVVLILSKHSSIIVYSAQANSGHSTTCIVAIDSASAYPGILAETSLLVGAVLYLFVCRNARRPSCLKAVELVLRSVKLGVLGSRITELRREAVHDAGSQARQVRHCQLRRTICFLVLDCECASPYFASCALA